MRANSKGRTEWPFDRQPVFQGIDLRNKIRIESEPVPTMRQIFLGPCELGTAGLIWAGSRFAD